MQVVVVATLAAGAAAASIRGMGQDRLQPEVVAGTFAKIQEKWDTEAAAFLACNQSCKEPVSEFMSSCGTVTQTIVKATRGNRDDLEQYMSIMCRQKVLESSQAVHCTILGDSITGIMDRGAFLSSDVDSVCTGMWGRLANEQAKAANEQAKAANEEAKAANETANASKSVANSTNGTTVSNNTNTSFLQMQTCPSTKIFVSMDENAAGTPTFVEAVSMSTPGVCVNTAVSGVELVKLCGPGEFTASRMSCEKHDYKPWTVTQPATEFTESDCKVYEMKGTNVEGYIGSASFTCSETAR